MDFLRLLRGFGLRCVGVWWSMDFVNMRTVRWSKPTALRYFQVWSLTDCKLRTNLVGHTSVLYTVTISPDGSLCASGGKDGVAMLWDVNEGKHLYSLDSNSTINALCFSPCNYWLCAATDKSVKVSCPFALFTRLYEPAASAVAFLVTLPCATAGKS